MDTLICSIIELLLQLREHYWEMDCDQPIWCWLGIRWCLTWLSDHTGIDEE